MELLTPDQIDALPDLEFLIDSILPCQSLCVLYGEPGCGKTFVALSMALSIAAGTPWLERQTRKDAVLYVAAEGILGMKYRLRAHRLRYGGKPENIRFIRDAIQLTDEEKLRELCDELRAAMFKPDLMILDTLARVTVGADENSAKDMGRVVDAVDALRKDLEATILLIHHTRKDGASERGSSALRGAADVMIECKKSSITEQIVVARCAKMKDAEPFADIEIGLEKIDLGGARTSLVAGVPPPFMKRTLIAGPANPNVEALKGILESKFVERGASHAELEHAFCEVTRSSPSTFARALKEASNAGRIRKVGEGKQTRYFGVGVTVT